MARAKILILIKSLGLGGAERLLVDSLPFLDRTRFDYHFAYILPWKNLLADEFAAEGFPIYCLGAANPVAAPRSDATTKTTFTAPRSVTGAFMLPAAYRRLAQLHRAQRFDLVHADLPTAGFLARTLGKRTGVHVVYSEHNMQERYHPATRAVNRLSYGWNDHVFAVSDEVVASIERHGMDGSTSVATLLNGVPVERVQSDAEDAGGLRAELNIGPDDLVVGSVAVFRPQKRLTDWVEMATQVAQAREDVIFLLVGDGPTMPEVQARIDELGLRERFRVPGFRDDGRRLLGLMDVYVMSSEHEGLPITLLEVMALGKPVVSTRAGGVPEVVEENVHGYLAPIGDTDAIADRVLRLLDDAELRSEFGRNGLQRVREEFHISRRVAAIEARYLALLAG